MASYSVIGSRRCRCRVRVDWMGMVDGWVRGSNASKYWICLCSREWGEAMEWRAGTGEDGAD